MTLSWRESAHIHIDRAFKEVKAARPELSADEVLDIVRLDHYPWGERRMLPYKMWLKAIKERRAKEGAKANLPVNFGLWEDAEAR